MHLFSGTQTIFHIQSFAELEGMGAEEVVLQVIDLSYRWCPLFA